MEPTQPENLTAQQQPIMTRSKFGKKKLIFIGITILALVSFASFLVIFFNSRQNPIDQKALVVEPGNAMLYFEPKSMNYQTNDSVTLPLFLQTSNTQVDEMIINLGFNPTIFTFLDLALGPQALPTSPYYEVTDYRIDNTNGIATFTVKKRDGVTEIPENTEVFQISFIPTDPQGANSSSITISETTSLRTINDATLDLESFDLLFSSSPSSTLSNDAEQRLQQQTDLLQSTQ